MKIIKRLKKIANIFQPNKYHYALVEYLSKELKGNKIKCRKREGYIKIDLNKTHDNKYDKMIIDCFDGNIYLRGLDIKDKKIGKLSRFGGHRESDALYCAKGGYKQILRHLEKINGHIVESNKQVKLKDMRKFNKTSNKQTILKDMRKPKKIANKQTVLKDMRKIATHDIDDRDFAICYIDGEILEGQTHTECINKYLQEKFNNKLNNNFYRPPTNKNDIVDMDDELDYETIKNSISQIAFAHMVDDEYAIYIEEYTLQNIDLNTIITAIQNKYPGYHIYNDDNYKKIARLKKCKKLKDMRKTAEHDIGNRDYALCYIDGKLLSADTHAECIDDYLKSYLMEDGLSDNYSRPFLNENDVKNGNNWDKMDYEMIKNNIKQMAFAHVDDNENSIYIEEDSLYNVDINTVSNTIKTKYSTYKIYNDDTDELVAKKYTRLKKIAIKNRDFAIAIINGNVYEGDTHGQAVSKFLKHMGISDEIELYDRYEIDEILGPNFTYQFAFAHVVGDKIYIENDTLQNINIIQAAQLIKNDYFDYEIYNENTDEKLAYVYRLKRRINSSFFLKNYLHK